MALRVFPINSSEDASSVPGVNDFDLLRIETNMLSSGVLESVVPAFEVVQRGAGANMSVDVGAGLALIEFENTNVAHGRTYKTWFESTAVVNKTIDAADPTNPRIDLVLLRVDVSVDPNGASSNIAIVEVLTGTPAGSPVAPALPDNAIPLAEVSVPASDTSITNGQITDARDFINILEGILLERPSKSVLASTGNGDGASLIGVEDAALNYSASNLEAVLAEIITKINAAASPTGAMMNWAAKDAPSGWLMCYGQAVSRSTYSSLFATISPSLGTFTVTIASPGVFTLNSHGLKAGDQVYFTTTGALPTGLSVNTIYYVISAGLTSNAFEVSATRGGAAINTSGSQSGVHTLRHCPWGLGDGSTTFNVPDLRGRFPLGWDFMGGSASSRVTAPYGGALNETVEGEEKHTLTVAELAAHHHDLSPDVFQNAGGGSNVKRIVDQGSTTATTKWTTTDAGSDTPHNNMPPYTTVAVIIKT